MKIATPSVAVASMLFLRLSTKRDKESPNTAAAPQLARIAIRLPSSPQTRMIHLTVSSPSVSSAVVARSLTTVAGSRMKSPTMTPAISDSTVLCETMASTSTVSVGTSDRKP